jgi:hypothetical protein
MKIVDPHAAINAAPSDNENALFHDIISIAAGEGRSLLPWCLEPDK